MNVFTDYASYWIDFGQISIIITCLCALTFFAWELSFRDWSDEK